MSHTNTGILAGSHHIPIAGGTLVDVKGNIQTCNCHELSILSKGWKLLCQKANFHALSNSSSRRLGRVNLSEECEETVCKVLEWIEDTSGTENILWVHGPSYVSPIAQTVADHQARRRHVPVATFFFDENLRPDDICAEFIATIAYQLCVASRPAMDCIVNCFAYDPAVLSRSSYDQLEKLVVKPIEAIISEDTGTIRSHQLFLIVDGCDYLEPEGTTLIVDILVETARQFPLDMRVLLCTKSSAGVIEHLAPAIQEGCAIEVECNTRSSSPEYPITNEPGGVSFPWQVLRCGVRVKKSLYLGQTFCLLVAVICSYHGSSALVLSREMFPEHKSL